MVKSDKMTGLDDTKQIRAEGGLLRAATWIALIILLSKIAGFLRDIVIANYYGAGLVSDAYFYAYQIPALVLVILGGVSGPFHSATVAVFSKLVTDLKAKPPAEVKKLFNTFETASLIVFIVLALLCFFFPTQIMRIIISDSSPELLSLASMHLKIMSPIVVIGAVIGIYYGILVTYKRFLLPNISPSLLSLGVIIVLFISRGDKTGAMLALGTTFGAFLQLMIQAPAVYKLGYSFKPSFDFLHNKNLNDICELLFPAFLSSTVGQIGIYIDMFFASGLKEGAWTAFGYANRIFQFPVGMLLTAILVPLFPLFSRLVAQKDLKGLEHYFTKGVGSLFFIGSYLMVTIFLIRTDAIHVALERGAFDHSATLLVSEILFFISLSILPYVFRDSATRLLYAFNDSKTPFVIAMFAIVLKILLNMLLVGPFGINGIALSTTLITLFNGALLGYFARKKVQIGYRKLFFVTLKILSAAAIAGLAGWAVQALFDKVQYWSLIFGIVKISVVSLVTLIVYIAASYVLKIEYLSELTERIKGKIASKFGGNSNAG